MKEISTSTTEIYVTSTNPPNTFYTESTLPEENTYPSFTQMVPLQQEHSFLNSANLKEGLVPDIPSNIYFDRKSTYLEPEQSFVPNSAYLSEPLVASLIPFSPLNTINGRLEAISTHPSSTSKHSTSRPNTAYTKEYNTPPSRKTTLSTTTASAISNKRPEYSSHVSAGTSYGQTNNYIDHSNDYVREHASQGTVLITEPTAQVNLPNSVYLSDRDPYKHHLVYPSVPKVPSSAPYNQKMIKDAVDNVEMDDNLQKTVNDFDSSNMENVFIQETTPEQDEEEEEAIQNTNYSFLTSVDDDISGGFQEHVEFRKGLKTYGKYSYDDGHNFITRYYIADDNGFRIVK